MVDVGQTISGKYKLLRLLGDGGMGSVYEAEHLRLGTHVAIKVLHGELTRRPGLMERFLQEARVSAQIRSPHVVQVTDVDGTPEGVAFLVMELLQGEPLSNVVRRERKLSVGTACEYTIQILKALEAAHALGVVHRDLKPDNVFVTFDGGKPVLKLIDFGIAKLKQADGAAATAKNLTVAGMLMGTPEYMAPEQAYSADKVDVRADLYSVGVMLYEMLSGQTPVSGDDPRIVVTKVERGEVTPLVNVAPGVQPALAGLVHRAMAPRPELRFVSAIEMRGELEAIASGKRAQTSPLAAAAAVPAAPAATAAPAVEIGTGTVMGAPAEAALATAPVMDPYAQAPGTGTMRGPPLDAGALTPAAVMAQPLAPTYEPSRTPERRSGGKGLIIGLALVATLLGASAVVVYVMGTQGVGGATPPPIDTTTAATTPTGTTATASTATIATATVPATVTGAPPLTTAPIPVKPPATKPTATNPPPHPTTPPTASPDGGTVTPPPPFVLPSGFPPIPSAFPSTLPSGFPPLPSGFPWPPPPPKSS